VGIIFVTNLDMNEVSPNFKSDEETYQDE